MDKKNFSLTNPTIIDIKKPKNKPYEVWETKICVPREAECLMNEIRYKRSKLGIRTVSRSIEWYTALRLYNHMLDCIDSKQTSLNTDMYQLIKLILDKEASPHI